MCGQEIKENILLDCLAAHIYRLSIYLSPLCVLCKENNSVTDQDNLPDCTVLNSGNTHFQNYTGLLEDEWNCPKCLSSKYYYYYMWVVAMKLWDCECGSWIACWYTKTFTSNLWHSIFYSLPLHVSATRSCHLQGATNCTDVHNIYCK